MAGWQANNAQIRNVAPADNCGHSFQLHGHSTYWDLDWLDDCLRPVFDRHLRRLSFRSSRSYRRTTCCCRFFLSRVFWGSDIMQAFQNRLTMEARMIDDKFGAHSSISSWRASVYVSSVLNHEDCHKKKKKNSGLWRRPEWIPLVTSNLGRK